MSQNINIEIDIIDKISKKIFSIYNDFMNEQMLDKLVVASTEYSSVLLQDLNKIINNAVKDSIPIYDSCIRNYEIENRLDMLSKFYISNLACYFESFDSTLNYFRRLVALDRYSEKYIGSFVSIILHDNSDSDPIKKYLIMVDSSNIDP
jgi:hypothetical protein